MTQMWQLPLLYSWFLHMTSAFGIVGAVDIVAGVLIYEKVWDDPLNLTQPWHYRIIMHIAVI